jgi:hypothetical protein
MTAASMGNTGAEYAEYSALAVDYICGSWVGVTGYGLWLLIETDPTQLFVRECWQLVDGRAGAADLLNLIHTHDPDQIPDFALLAVRDESTHAAVRGNASIRLLGTAGGPVTLLRGTAGNVSTLFGGATAAAVDQTTDRLLDWPAINFQLAAGFESAWPPRDGFPMLPLNAGVVLASAIGGRLKPTVAQVNPVDQPEQVDQSAQADQAKQAEQSELPELLEQLDLPEENSQPYSAGLETDGFESGESEPDGFEEDPDLAPTQLIAPRSEVIPARSELSPVPSEVSQARTIPSPAELSLPALAPPSGPRIELDNGPDRDSDGELIWKLDWWNSANPSTSSSDGQTSQASNQDLVEEDTSITVHRLSAGSSGSDVTGLQPQVPAAYCPVGHLNPPQATNCRVCAAVVPPQESVQVPQPVLGVLRLSIGGDIPLDRDVFLGRDPSNDEQRKARKPHILRLPSPGKDISRDHLEIRLVGWRVMVIDLGATNGTTIIPPGGTPEALVAGGSRMIEPGTQVVLADEVSFVFEVTG